MTDSLPASLVRAAPRALRADHYAGWAGVYDRLVGGVRYNRAMWGNDPRGYTAFAAAAMEEADGPFLEAGCGSLLFTAVLYQQHRAPIVALDQSRAMLDRARARLSAPTGRVPCHVALVQGDLFAPPVAPGRFRAILFLGVMHLFEPPRATALVAALMDLLAPGGRLFLTSLITSGRWPSDRYLALIHRAGEIAPPLGADELRRLLARLGCLSYAVKGNMVYAVLARDGAVAGG